MDLLRNARSKLMRRGSATSTRSIKSSGSETQLAKSSLRKSISLSKLPEVTDVPVEEEEEASDGRLSKSAVLPTRDSFSGSGTGTEGSSSITDRRARENNPNPNPNPNSTTTTTTTQTHITQAPVPFRTPLVTLEEPSPIPLPVSAAGLAQYGPIDSALGTEPSPSEGSQPSPAQSSSSKKLTPPEAVRRQSIVPTSNARVITTLLAPEASQPALTPGPPTADYFTPAPGFSAAMLHRKIWVKRANASATLVQIREDDLVDDVRDMILKKYANSLGRSFDAPDVVLRICPRESNTAKTGDRLLGPEEDMCRTLDAYYPGGQTVNEALLIEVPQRRTPKPSPRVPLYYSHHDDTRPYESASEYFPPMPVVNPSPAALTANSHETRVPLPHASHSIAVLQTGQLPLLPSPGSTRRGYHGRPRNPRHTTASPTTLANANAPSASNVRPINRPRHDSSASDTKHSTTAAHPIPTPPAPIDTVARQNSTPPTPRISSPRPEKKKRKQKAVEAPSLPAGLLDGSVPPINVLIVEDNIINLRVLGAFMQRLKVRWQRAMNGKEAVTKWRAGGFHLVLMDIQLPIMNGLDATKEIRRLERVNSIGVFSSGSSEAPNNILAENGGTGREVHEDDKLGEKNMFKSPVIIVALTASSLQSDRHEALAAGCNDFLTKPVNFVWLERKVKEWGCMQALIDFDGWRKWKDFAAQSDSASGPAKLSASKSSIAKGKSKVNQSPILAANPAMNNSFTTANGAASTSKSKEEERKKRRSFGVMLPPALPEEESSAGTPDIDSSCG